MVQRRMYGHSGKYYQLLRQKSINRVHTPVTKQEGTHSTALLGCKVGIHINTCT